MQKVKNILKPSKRMDETERILSNPTMVKKLEKSVRQAEDGKTRTIMLDEIWKLFTDSAYEDLEHWKSCGRFYS